MKNQGANLQSSSKKRVVAKQAFKKKQKSATKFKNDQLRESLDCQACQVQAVYLVQQPKTISSSAMNPKTDSVDDLLAGLTKM